MAGAGQSPAIRSSRNEYHDPSARLRRAPARPVTLALDARREARCRGTACRPLFVSPGEADYLEKRRCISAWAGRALPLRGPALGQNARLRRAPAQTVHSGEIPAPSSVSQHRIRFRGSTHWHSPIARRADRGWRIRPDGALSGCMRSPPIPTRRLWHPHGGGGPVSTANGVR